MNTVDEFEKKFPNLANEMKQCEMLIKIRSSRTETENELKDPEKFSGYIPDVVGFIRRCGNAEEAKEIIDFLEKRGEISHEYAVKLHTQLQERGLRSFGSKKECGYYFR